MVFFISIGPVMSCQSVKTDCEISEKSESISKQLHGGNEPCFLVEPTLSMGEQSLKFELLLSSSCGDIKIDIACGHTTFAREKVRIFV